MHSKMGIIQGVCETFFFSLLAYFFPSITSKFVVLSHSRAHTPYISILHLWLLFFHSQFTQKFSKPELFIENFFLFSFFSPSWKKNFKFFSNHILSTFLWHFVYVFDMHYNIIDLWWGLLIIFSISQLLNPLKIYLFALSFCLLSIITFSSYTKKFPFLFGKRR